MKYNKIEIYILTKLKKNIQAYIYESVKLKNENFIRDVINSMKSEAKKDINRLKKIENYIFIFNTKNKNISIKNKYDNQKQNILKLKLFLRLNILLEKIFKFKISFFQLWLFFREYPFYKNYNIIKIFLIICSISITLIIEIINHYYYPFNLNFVNISLEDIKKL